MKFIKTALNGLCMSVANSVPGVSGGNIALLLGFYDDFITAINDIIYKKGRRRRGAAYLLTMGSGWIVGMVTCIFLLNAIFEEQIYGISSLFFGFMLCSLPFMVYEERKCMTGRYGNVIFSFLGFGLIFGVTYASTRSGGGYDMSVLTPGSAVTLFFVGILSVAAMLLPGVSGSTVFLMFGLYQPIMAAFKSLLTLDVSVIPSLLFLGAGAIAGFACTIKLVKLCLRSFRSQTVYATVGMLIGSLYSLMMGPLTLEPPKPPMWPTRFNWPLLLVGAAIVGFIELIKFRRGRRDGRENGLEPDAK